MAASKFFNRVQFNAAAGGLGGFAVASGNVGFHTPAQAGVTDGTVVSYTAQNDTSNNPAEWETGQGVYTAGTLTVSRATLRDSSTGAFVNFTAPPLVFLDFQAQDVGIVRDAALDASLVFTGGAERMRIDTNGLVGINITPTAVFHVASDASLIDSFLFETYSSGSPPLLRLYNHRGAKGTHGALIAGDAYGEIRFLGDDGTFQIEAAGIASNMDGLTPGALNMPGNLMFFTTPGGGFTPAERMRIKNNGMVAINTTGAVFGGFPVQFTVATDTNANWLSRFASFGNNSFSIVNLYSKTRGATPDTQGALINGDALLEFRVLASDGINFVKSGSINFDVNGTVAAGVVPTTISFFNMDAAGLNQNRIFVSVGGQTQFVNNDGVNTTAVNRLAQARRLGSALAVGAGAGYSFAVQTPNSGTLESGAIDNIMTATGLGAEAFDMRFFLRSAAALTERMRLVPSGLGIGTSNVFGQIHTAQDPSVLGGNNAWFEAYGNNAFGTGMTTVKTRGATQGSHGLVVSGDNLFDWTSYGDDGSTVIPAARMRAVAEGTPALGNMPGRLTFWTNPGGGILERWRIDSSGRLISGGNVAMQFDTDGAAITPLVQALGTSSATASLAAARFSNDANSCRQFFGKARGAAVGTFTALTLNDGVGDFYFDGADGTQFNTGAKFGAAVDGTVSAANVPMRLYFATVPVGGGATSVERFRIAQDGLATFAFNGIANNSINIQGPVMVQTISTNAPWGFGQHVYGNNSGQAGFIFSKTRNAVPGGHTAVVAGDRVSEMRFFGSDGTQYVEAGMYRALVEGTVSAGVVQARHEWSACRSDGVDVLWMSLDSAGTLALRNPTITGNVNADVYAGVNAMYGDT